MVDGRQPSGWLDAARSDEVRFFTLEGDTLTIKTERSKSPIDGRESVGIIVWQKVK